MISDLVLELVDDSYRASMRFLASVSSHMDYEHVLSFEWFLRPWAGLPLADKQLLVGSYVIVVQMFDQVVLGPEFFITTPPMTMGLHKIWLFFNIIFITRACITRGNPQGTILGPFRSLSRRSVIAIVILHGTWNNVGWVLRGHFRIS